MAKCVECGFLAIRLEEGGTLHEATFNFRETGTPPQPLGKYTSDLYSPYPVCIWRLRLFENLVRGRTRDQQPEAVRGLLSIEILCGQFYRYRPTASPKEHVEMQLRDEERKWQETRLEADREWREKQVAEERRWRKIELFVLGVFAVLAAGGFTILGAFIQRGSIL